MGIPWSPAEEWALGALWDQRPPSWPGWGKALPGRSKSARRQHAVHMGLEPRSAEWWDGWAASKGGGWATSQLLTPEWWDWFGGGGRGDQGPVDR